MKLLKVYAFFFAVLLVGAFIGSQTRELLDENYYKDLTLKVNIETIPAPHLAVNIEDKEKRVYIGPNDNPNIVWAGSDMTQASVYSSGEFYVEPELGVRLLVKSEIINGKSAYDIFAFPDKKEIYGNTNRAPDNTLGSGSGK